VHAVGNDDESDRRRKNRTRCMVHLAVVRESTRPAPR